MIILPDKSVAASTILLLPRRQQMTGSNMIAFTTLRETAIYAKPSYANIARLRQSIMAHTGLQDGKKLPCSSNIYVMYNTKIKIQFNAWNERTNTLYTIWYTISTFTFSSNVWLHIYIYGNLQHRTNGIMLHQFLLMISLIGMDVLWMMIVA